MNRQKLTGYLFIFIGIYLLLFFLLPAKPSEQQNQPEKSVQESITLDPVKKDLSFGETVKIVVNNTGTGAVLFTPQPCPQAPLPVEKDGQSLNFETPYTCKNDPVEIAPGTKHTISFDKWNNALFSQEGSYLIRFTTNVNDTVQNYTTTVNIHTAGWFGQAWDTLLYRPIYNTLIFLATVFPGYDLGWAIIVLTLIIRLVLLVPNQKALEQQKKLQKIQPKIAEIQKKYEGDQQKIGEETLKLWKEYKVNPAGSCLPILLQLPVLIALYYAIGHGLDVGSTYFLYEPLKYFNVETINSHFLGVLDLSQPNVLVLPIVLGILQFVQMKLSLQRAAKKKEKEQPKKKEAASADPNAMMNKSMTYVFPVLIAFMSAGFPAGVSLYWGISTIFGILQQIWVNQEKNMG